MTDFASQHVGASTNPVARFFASIWSGMVFLAENSARARAVQQLNEMSDAELEARGVTRQDMVRKIFADKFYL